GFVPSITKVIEVAAINLRLTLEMLTTPPTAELSQLVGLRHLTAQMAESAGRERALLAAVIDARRKLTVDDVRKVSGFRGQIDLAWGTISPITQRPGVPAKIVDAVARVE